ncbi:type VI secretion system baseplate subunit TssG [Psychrobacter aestuarii]|uniref:Type VI secretion system baseplate subunit TssG n=1 Tax=Psychrobacter aestuarii TaxID=556327 RepID=A0ABP3FIZ5_9GAMM|nr:type VI secretion system baseplate subunit TssG [Psychrobacter aestuarii]
MSAPQRFCSSYLGSLLAEPQRYELVQAYRLIQQAVNRSEQPITVNFRASLSLAFPLAEIESMTLQPQESWDNHQPSLDICPSVIGLTGPLSAMPALYTDYLASRVQHGKDKAAAAFMDLFNHRLTQLYVDASWFYHLPLQYEMGTQNDKYLLSLRSLARQPKKISTTDSLIAYAGTIAPGRLTAAQLAHALSRFLNIKVTVEQFVAEWFDLPSEEQTALGTQYASLGVSTFCGSRVVQYDSKIRLICHRLNEEEYLRLLPSGDMCRVIVDFVRKWCGITLAIEMTLELHKRHIHGLQLNKNSLGGLGQGNFLCSKPATEHHRDTRYLLPAA